MRGAVSEFRKPEARDTIGNPPRWLPRAARRVWRTFQRDPWARAHLTAIDRGALVTYCWLSAEMERSIRAGERSDWRLFRQWLLLARQLGATPRARTAIDRGRS